jgi:hypothetical protein
MRIRIILILTAFLLLVFLTINAYSIRWNEPGSQSVDEMFTNDNRSLDEGYGVVHTGSFSSGSSDTESAGAFDAGQGPIGKKSDVQAQSQSSESTTISGKWTMELNFGAPPKATLTLYQDEDAVYGTGYISLDAKTNLEVAVGGTVMGDKLDFDMITLKKVSLYRVSMTISGNSAAGSYTAFKPGEAPSSGTIRGLRSVV